MWTPTTRKKHNRKTSRYQTDMTDEEWRVIGPHLPAANSTGRPRAWPMREIINGIFYVMRSGCPWRLLPSDLPPWSTIYRWFAQFRDEGRFEKINHALVMLDRERIGRQASPTGAIIDSQSVKTTEAGGPRGYDAGKKINGRKRHALVDTDGRGLVLEPHPASIQDRETAVGVWDRDMGVVDDRGDEGQGDRDKESHPFGWCELQHCVVPPASPEVGDVTLASGAFL